jgi:hypothetical protein
VIEGAEGVRGYLFEGEQPELELAATAVFPRGVVIAVEAERD